MSNCFEVLKTAGQALIPGLTLMTLMLPPAGAAENYCSAPVAPYCVDKDSEFDSVLQINRCEEDLGDYQEQLDTYQQCITEQLSTERKRLKEAHDLLNRAREKF